MEFSNCDYKMLLKYEFHKVFALELFATDLSSLTP